MTDNLDKNEEALIRAIGHAFRRDLVSAIDLANLLLSEYDKSHPMEFAKDVQNIRDKATNALNLTDALLDLVRVSQAFSVPKDINVRQVLQENQAQIAAARQIKPLYVHSDSELPFVQVDPEGLVSVIVHMVNMINPSKDSPLRIEVDSDARGVAITVSGVKLTLDWGNTLQDGLPISVLMSGLFCRRFAGYYEGTFQVQEDRAAITVAASRLWLPISPINLSP